MRTLPAVTLCIMLCTVAAGAQHRAVPGEHGMAVSADLRASRAGIDMLRQGGNVVDAAVAMGFVLAVTYPRAGNIGGGGFAVLSLGDSGTFALDFRETAPARAWDGMFLDSLGNADPERSTIGALAAGVPGTVAGLAEMHRRFGALPWERCLEPARRLAADGFLLTSDDTASFNGFLAGLYPFPSSRRYFTRGDSTTRFSPGETFVQHDLAETLEAVQREGAAGFYAGRTARLVVEEMRRSGGWITMEDLATYRPVWRTPLEGTYRGCRLVTMPPPSSGGWGLLSLLKMVEPYRLDTLGRHSSATVHLMGEAMTRVFADRAEYLGDPDAVAIPLEGLLDSLYLAGRMRSFDPLRVSDSGSVGPGLPPGTESRETTHFCVADRSGNIVALTTTLNHSFGSRLAVGGAGFLLNNEMDDFSAKPNVPNAFGLLGGRANSIRSGRRMLSSMTPTIVFRDGRPWFTVGAPGGPTIITRVFQVVCNVIDFGMGIRDAVAALRFHHQGPANEIEYEPGAFTADVLENLRRRGWDLRALPGWDNGGMEAILIENTGMLQGAADPRRGDAAWGY